MLDEMPVIRIGASPLRIADVLQTAAGRARVALDESKAFRQRIERSVELLDRLIADGQPIYGVTTGFGDSCEKTVPT